MRPTIYLAALTVLQISTAQAAAAHGAHSDPMAGLPVMALIAGAMYFMLTRPQQKRQKALTALLGSLKKGDDVKTNGGLIGCVESVKDDVIALRIAKNTLVSLSKHAVSSILPKGAFEAQ